MTNEQKGWEESAGEIARSIWNHKEYDGNGYYFSVKEKDAGNKLIDFIKSVELSALERGRGLAEECYENGFNDGYSECQKTASEDIRDNYQQK